MSSTTHLFSWKLIPWVEFPKRCSEEKWFPRPLYRQAQRHQGTHTEFHRSSQEVDNDPRTIQGWCWPRLDQEKTVKWHHICFLRESACSSRHAEDLDAQTQGQTPFFGRIKRYLRIDINVSVVVDTLAERSADCPRGWPNTYPKSPMAQTRRHKWQKAINKMKPELCVQKQTILSLILPW